MSLMIKICGLKTPEDVATAVEAGADAVGFVFAESVRCVTPVQAKLASQEAPDHVLRVAVMKHPDQALVDAVIDEFEPDVVQTDVDDFTKICLPIGTTTWPVFRQGFSEPAGQRTFLYEGRSSGSGETVDWKIAAQHAAGGGLILAGGLDPDNVAAAIETVRPYGVDVSSGVERERGIKDPDRIYAFTKAARAAEKTA